ncbi:hypothetical protein MMC26_005790 [Xylographa opegraphella]|nr:hypothetical protein [Xylographa opegraphella]
MNRDSINTRADVSRGSVDMDILKSSPSTKKRKNGSLRMIVRKLFGRKSVKSQISLPTPTKNLEHDPSAFITSPRAVSLPIQEISRTSALGSHSPFNLPAGPRVVSGATDVPERSVARPRGASLPSVIMNPPEPVVLPAGEASPKAEQAAARTEEDENIGFAVTSGSNPKRRSRSADAFYDATRGHRLSPIQWRQWRRRSDEIKYWRDSVAESPALKSKFDDDDGSSVEGAPEEAPAPVAETGDQEDDINRDTFDFGILATSMQEQEPVSIEERVVTMEVKLMDLEYAISKIQAQSHSPVNLPPDVKQSAVRGRSPSLRSTASESSLQARAMEQSTSTNEGSESTQPTSQSSNEPVGKQKVRPISNAPTIRPAKVDPQSPKVQDSPPKRNRNSITSLTIDHYTTLIGLIRREQAARIRLEDQVTDLQRQIMSMKTASPADSRSRIPRWQGNTYHPNSSAVSDYRGGRYTHDLDETDTDDGFQDVYETPIERREFEGGPFAGPYEGEAF